MPRARPVHVLSSEEAALACAIADERAAPTEEAHALRLKATIEAFWAARGWAVKVSVGFTDFSNSYRGRASELRSDMRNGLPVRRAGA